MLKIMQLSKTYKNGKKAVDQLSLTVEAGDIYGFIGHNGAGKTTTIRAVVGILDFEQGDIQIDGISIKEDPISCKKKLAYIPDNPDFFCVPKDIREKQIREYANRLELMANLGDLISSYSHGMKQKLAIVSALIHRPKLLVLDEPFVGLDPKASHTLKEIMHELCQEGSAIFFSTHVLDVAEKLCNKIAIIKGGKLIASGSTEEVRGTSSLEDVFLELIDHA